MATTAANASTTSSATNSSSSGPGSSSSSHHHQHRHRHSSSNNNNQSSASSSNGGLVVPLAEVWSRQVDRSTALVPKLIKILRARGLQPPTAPSDFSPVEDALGCPIPPDFKALTEALPSATTAWGLDPFYLFSAAEMWTEMQQLKQVTLSRPDYNGVSMDWEPAKRNDHENSHKHTHFVPIGNSTSAFYIGYIKTSMDYRTQPWELVVLDSKNHFEYEPGDGTFRPFVETLYRMVVKAVTPEVWATRSSLYKVCYFWHSEEESEEAEIGMTTFAPDGSQDVRASTPERIIVLGRPVCYVGGKDPEAVSLTRQEAEQMWPAAQGSLLDGGVTEADFMGVGVYNITHPIDAQVQQEEKRLREAPREEARVDVQDLLDNGKGEAKDAGASSSSSNNNNKSSDSSITTSSTDKNNNQRWHLVKDKAMAKAFHCANVLRKRVAVGERWAAFIGTNGHLGMVDTSNQYMWWNTTANGMLQDDEVFTQLDMAGYHCVVLTSKGRVLTIRGYPIIPTYAWRSFDKLRKEVMPFDVVGVSAGEHAAAAITKEGRIIYWGSVLSSKGDLTVQEPFFVPNMINIVDINLKGRGMCILHSNGRVSLITKKSGLRVLDPSLQTVAVHAAGDHVFLMNPEGQVRGLGDRLAGQLPVALNAKAFEDYEQAKVSYQKEFEDYGERLSRFRETMVEHAKSCPKSSKHDESSAAEMDTTATDSWSPTISKGVYVNIAEATHVHGVAHTPEQCSAPVIPADLKASPRPPVPPTEPGQPLLTDPTILSVGPDLEAAQEEAEKLTERGAWNDVKGPYGAPLGSFSPTACVAGVDLCSVFLHTDGRISACGDGRLICNGLTPPNSSPPVSGLRMVQLRDGTQVQRWGEVGLPVSVSPPDVKFIGVVVGRAGMLAVQEDGRIWGCGESVGTAEAALRLQKLVVLR